jgi:galactonate dehydratase
LREFLPYFREQAMDVAIIDAVWNGVWQVMKIAAAAEAFEVNIAPHNFYGHLATMMNAHFAAATPNLRIMEVDIDRLPWDEELFSVMPQFENGQLIVPPTPGWGTEPNEEAIRAHPERAELLSLSRDQPNPTRKRSARIPQRCPGACCTTDSFERLTIPAVTCGEAPVAGSVDY